MRKLFTPLISTFSLMLYSVCISASPIDFTSFDRMIPQTITSDCYSLVNEGVMTSADFTESMVKTIQVEVIEHVPIKY